MLGAIPEVAAAQRAGSAPQPGCTRGAEGPQLVPGAGGGGELCETALPFAKAYGAPCILGCAGLSWAGLAWISVCP